MEVRAEGENERKRPQKKETGGEVRTRNSEVFSKAGT